MKISRTQLQAYFAEPLPDIAALVDAFTFHSFEIDGVAGEVLDVKVLPNRAADCGTEEGVARELAAILDVPLTNPPAFVPAPTSIQVSLARINGILGASFTEAEVLDVLRRIRAEVVIDGDMYRITPPADRVDLTIPEDIAEEVGRLIGYDRVVPMQLPVSTHVADQNRFHGIERMKDHLVAAGFAEVSTQSFTTSGEVVLANPLDTTRPALRPSLTETLAQAQERAMQYAPRILPPKETPKLFEVGTVFPASGEYLELRTTEPMAEGVPVTDNLSAANLETYGAEYTPKRYTLSAFKPFSSYPFALRDIAAWAPAGETAETTAERIRSAAGALLVRTDLFDSFTKEDKTSFAFRLVFEAPDHTLTDTELTDAMARVAQALTATGYVIR